MKTKMKPFSIIFVFKSDIGDTIEELLSTLSKIKLKSR